MAKIHRSDAPLPQAPSVQVKASYTVTVTDLPQASPQEPAAFYDQDNDEDYRRRETAKCKKKRGNLLYTLAMIVFAAIFLISGGLLVKRFLDDRKTESEFADLQSMIDTAATLAPAGENVNPNGARFAALRDKNSDFIGWISIDGTNLDFPVMYAPDNKDFYLRHDFNKAYSVYGVPYLDEQTTRGANAGVRRVHHRCRQRHLVYLQPVHRHGRGRLQPLCGPGHLPQRRGQRHPPFLR